MKCEKLQTLAIIFSLCACAVVIGVGINVNNIGAIVAAILIFIVILGYAFWRGLNS